MQKRNKDQAAQQLTKHTELFKKSFVSERLELSDDHLTIISRYVGNNVSNIVALPARKFAISIKDVFDFTVNLSGSGNSLNESRDIIYYPFVIQTFSRSYLVVASKFNIYDVLDREPYHESIGEFRYQVQLAKALGLRHAVAYDTLHNQIIDEKEVVEDDLELMYCGDDSFSFLIYSL